METEAQEVIPPVAESTKTEEPIPQPIENPPEETSVTTPIIPDDQQLIQSIRKIIDAGDLETLTFNQVFNVLSKEFFQADLTEKKAFLKQKLLEIISQKNDENDHQEEEKPKKPNKAKKEKKKEPSKKSPAKKAKKEKEVQSDESSEEEKTTGKDMTKQSSFNELDAAALGITEAEYELQKQLLEAVKTGVMPSTRRTRSGNSATPTKRASNGKRKTNGKKTAEDSESEDGEGEPGSPKKKKRGFVAKNMALSEALSEFLGKNMIPRTEVVKDLHAYFKEHNLQNPANRRQILFDEKLQSVFKVKSTDYFKLNKLISKHVKPADEVV